MLEIERKFLVNSFDFINEAYAKHEIAQGYLNSNPERAVRIRIKEDKGYITIKGIGNASGTSRFEWEKEIPVDEARQLMQLCENGGIQKTRYEIRSGIHIIEVDVFHGNNQGLVLAEIELDNEQQSIVKPEWLGAEVTGDKRYYNSYLNTHPYLSW